MKIRAKHIITASILAGTGGGLLGAYATRQDPTIPLSVEEAIKAFDKGAAIACWVIPPTNDDMTAGLITDRSAFGARRVLLDLLPLKDGIVCIKGDGTEDVANRFDALARGDLSSVRPQPPHASPPVPRGKSF